MNRRKLLAAVRLIGVSFLGGVFGATLLGTANAATTTQTPTPSTSSGSSASADPAPSNTGTFRSNEDPTHEAGESAAREAAEDSGTASYGPQGG